MILKGGVPLQNHSIAVAAEREQKTPRQGSVVSNRSKEVRELIEAAANGDTRKVIQLLDRGVNVNASYQRDDSELSGMTALMAASARGHSETTAQLINRRANVNLKRYTGETPLMLAAGSGNPETTKILLAARANPNTRVMSPHAGELTPLIIAINADSQRRVEIVTALLDAKAEVNPKGRFFLSPLMHAVRDLQIVKLLIARGAEVNQRNFRGATALMGAATGGSVAVVRYLLEMGADMEARDNQGNTALNYAQNRRDVLDPSSREEIIQILRRRKW